jgi:hypothetical protein
MLSLETPFNFRTNNSWGIQVCEENEADLIYYLLWDIESPKKKSFPENKKSATEFEKENPCF